MPEYDKQNWASGEHIDEQRITDMDVGVETANKYTVQYGETDPPNAETLDEPNSIYINTDNNTIFYYEDGSWVKIDEYEPVSHSTTHEDGGDDEINVSGLSGVLSDAQLPQTHSNTHEDGGADEIDVGGLSGVLSEAQPPQTHNNAAHDPNFFREDGVLEAWQLSVEPSDTWRHIMSVEQPITSSDWVKLAEFDFQQQIKNFRVYYKLSASFEEPSVESADLRLTWDGSVITDSQITLESSGNIDNTKDLEFTTAGRLAVEGRATLTGTSMANCTEFKVGYDMADPSRDVDIWTQY